jgi:hypothetical protein
LIISPDAERADRTGASAHAGIDSPDKSVFKIILTIDFFVNG